MQLLQQTQRVGNRREVSNLLSAQRELLARISAELFRNAKRMKRAEAMMELEQLQHRSR